MASDRIDVIWSDLHPEIIPDGSGDVKVVENVASVMGSIDNILRTRKGERVMLPEFGSNLSSIVFENIDDTLMKFIAHEVKESIERWDDRVSVEQVRAETDPDKAYVSIVVKFRIRGYGNSIFEHSVLLRGE
jgi:phage baseplate assembly protein W